jgi:CRP/FNR family transcriptional regulator, cyclic AMP receptor protein
MEKIDQLQRLVFRTGVTIFRTGDPGDCAYVIQSGVVDIVRKVGGKPRTIASLAAGEMFGEMALIDGRRRMADAVTAAETTLLVVSAFQVKEKLRAADPFMRALVRMFVENLRVTTRNALVATDRIDAMAAALRQAGLNVPPENPAAYDGADSARG